MVSWYYIQQFLKMPQYNRSHPKDQDFSFQTAPKRNNYKRVAKKTKRQLVTLYLSKNLKIAELSKRFHLSYATVAHIIKTKKPVQGELLVKKEEEEDSANEEAQEIKQEPSLPPRIQSLELKEEQQKYPCYYPFAPFLFPILY